MALRLSHSARDKYLLCPKKYFFYYKSKLRPRAKGSALYFGSAFDSATDILFQGKSVKEAQQDFTDKWMRHEGNLNVKFAKNDFNYKLLTTIDKDRLALCADNLNDSKPLQKYRETGDIAFLIKGLLKFKNDDIRDLSPEEEQFTHFSNLLCMHNKGLAMIDSFNEGIMKHVTKVVGSQVPIKILHPDGHTVIGYIDLLCSMEGYVVSETKTLTKDDLIVADVKSAGMMSWKKLDNLKNSPQLDTYLISPEVQSIQATNWVAYFVTAKVPVFESTATCKECGFIKSSSHKTCNNKVDGKRCGGEWDIKEKATFPSKIVIGERDINEASLMYEDFDDVLVGIQSGVFPRNRESCNAFGGVCDYMDICGKCYPDPTDFDNAVIDWKKRKGE